MSRVRVLPSPGDGVPEGIVAAIRERSTVEPVAAIVLGSGLGGVLEVAGAAAGRSEGLEIPYGDLPGFPPPSVPGHAGKLWLGELGDRPFAVFLGRIHYYEGHPMRLASLTARVAALLGAGTIVLTAATGAVDRVLPAGSLVVLRDHINQMGENPLRGWMMPDGSPPFIDVSEVYDRELADTALRAAKDARVGEGANPLPVSEGVYVAVSGPSYETPAETEAFRRAGATVVGMSMVPEAVAARALGMRVLGLSFVTNAAGAAVSHEEVLEASDHAAEAIGRVLAELLEKL
jgi:purine-nucleoside phosphorylase